MKKSIIQQMRGAHVSRHAVAHSRASIEREEWEVFGCRRWMRSGTVTLPSGQCVLVEADGDVGRTANVSLQYVWDGVSYWTFLRPGLARELSNESLRRAAVAFVRRVTAERTPAKEAP